MAKVVTAEEALIGMHDFTKNGEFYDSDTNRYVKQMDDKYACYLKEDTIASWIDEIRENILLGLPLDYDDYDLAVASRRLKLFECAGEVMEHMANGELWEEISDIIFIKYECSNPEFEIIGDILLRYSPHGIEFVEQVGPPKGQRLYLMPHLNKSLIEAKKEAKKEARKKDKAKSKRIYHNS